jgi:hypothetical protein
MNEIMKHLYIIPVWLLLCCTCTDQAKQTKVVTAFPKTGELKAHIQKIPEPVLLPRFMSIANDYLFVYKEKEARLFEVFHLPEGTYLCSAGGRGQGPDDFGLLDSRSFHACGNGFKVMEAGSNLLKTVEFENNQLHVSHAERMLENPSNNGFYPLADSIYLTLGNIGDLTEYNLLDSKTGNITKTGDYPQWAGTNVTEPGQVFFTYVKSCVVHPDGKKFAAFYGRFKRFRIYDRSAALLHDVDVGIEPSSAEMENGQAVSAYYISQPQAIGNHIYALCANAQDHRPDRPNGCELQVWDWDGNPVACYRLDRKISFIAISEKYGKLYALDMSVDDELYSYDLPELKK